MSRIARIAFLFVVIAGAAGINSAGAFPRHPALPVVQELTIDQIVSMSAVSTADEYTTTTINGITVIEYTQRSEVPGHAYNFFKLESGVGFCVEDAGSWIIVNKIHIVVATDTQGRFCGTVPQGWDPIWVDYPTHGYFSYGSANKLGEAIGWIGTPIVI